MRYGYTESVLQRLQREKDERWAIEEERIQIEKKRKREFIGMAIAIPVIMALLLGFYLLVA